jgi:hypothetical protein
MPAQFDIIYAFNAFYAFPDQQGALDALRLAAKPDAIPCLFDYLDRGGFTETRFAGKPETQLWRPLSMESLPSELDETGWSLGEWLDISAHFETWYAELVNRFAMRRQQLLNLFASELINYAEDYYCCPARGDQSRRTGRRPRLRAGEVTQRLNDAACQN